MNSAEVLCETTNLKPADSCEHTGLLSQGAYQQAFARGAGNPRGGSTQD